MLIGRGYFRFILSIISYFCTYISKTCSERDVTMRTADRLITNTIHIKTKNNDGALSTGTGFFFEFCRSENGECVPAIVTNKHVIDGAQSGTLRFRTIDDNGDLKDDEFFDFNVEDFERAWIKHPNREIDLAILPISQFFSNMVAQGKKPFFPGLDKSTIPNEESVKTLSAIENIIMIGYPNGMWDQKNNIPIVRRGITATNYQLDYEGKKEFLIDCACFPGSSGSPIFLLDEGVRMTQSGQVQFSSRFHFLGILWGGPQFSTRGNLIAVPVPTKNQVISISNIPMNLGFCIKSNLLMDFEEIIRIRLQRENIKS